MSYDYLKDAGANPMFEHMALEIKKYNCNTILDLGCGYSRVNEFLTDYDYRLVGIDNDPDVVDECTLKYQQDNIVIMHDDVIRFLKESRGQTYDCIILSGLLYYFKPGVFEYTAQELVDRIIKTFRPRIVIIAEPRPSVVYKTSDLMPVLASWSYSSAFFDMDIRMGERVVYTLIADRPRSVFNRKIKAEFNADSIHNHHQQFDFDDNGLLKTVYLTNTETLNDLYPGDATHYISVCAGFKSLYKACMDWEPGRKFQFTYVDVVPTAIDFRMYLDQMYPRQKNLASVIKRYQKEVNPQMLYIMGDGKTVDELDQVVEQQLQQLEIRDRWPEFVQEYAQAPKTYLRVDAVNNIKLLNNFIAGSPEQKWFWYSNIHDWHQFRFTETTFYNWQQYLEDRNNIEFCGKVPPFTST